MPKYKFIGTEQDLSRHGFRLYNGGGRFGGAVLNERENTEIYVSFITYIVDFNWFETQEKARRGEIKLETFIQDLIDKGLVVEVKENKK